MTAGAAGEAAPAVFALQGLSKNFGAQAVLSDVTFSVAGGTLCAVVGPNGAGKSTLIGVVAGLVRPSAGTASVGGHDVVRARRRALQTLGALVDVPELAEDLTVAELVRHVAIVRGVGPAAARSRVADLIELLDLPARQVIRYLSTGNRKKTGLACALVGSPQGLVLDEPLESVDPVTAERIIGLLRARADAGVAVLVSTHDLGFAARCDEVIVMAEGRVVRHLADPHQMAQAIEQELTGLADQARQPPAWLTQ